MKWLALHIGGQDIGVHLVKATDPRLEDGIGLYDPDLGRIYISNALEPGPREDTLFHELDHAVNEISGSNNLLFGAVRAARKQGDAADAAAFALEETLVRARTPIWHRLLKDLGFQFPKGPTE